MINYNKNKLINECLAHYYATFEQTLDTADFVPEKFNKKIYRYIYKNMKKAFKKVDREDRLYQRNLVKKQKENERNKRRELHKKQVNHE